VVKMENYKPLMTLRNNRKNGPTETFKYNMLLNELKINLEYLKNGKNKNTEILETDILNIIKENAELIRRLSYLKKKFDFIKQYRFKGE